MEQQVIKAVAPETSDAYRDDAAHYTFICGIDDNCELDAVQYLYDRLNIIDAKANSLLTVNVLSLGVVSFIGTIGTQLGKVDRAGVVRWSGEAAVVFAIVGIFLALWISRLKFDHVTPSRTRQQYLTSFHQVTIARQKILAAARGFTFMAFLLYGTFALLALALPPKGA